MRLLILVVMVGFIFFSQGCCTIMLTVHSIGERKEYLSPMEMYRKEDDRVVVFSTDRWSKENTPLQYRIIPLIPIEKSEPMRWTVDFSSGIPDGTINYSTLTEVNKYIESNQFVLENTTKIKNDTIKSLVDPRYYAYSAEVSYTTPLGYASKALYVPAVAVDIVTLPLQIVGAVIVVVYIQANGGLIGRIF